MRFDGKKYRDCKWCQGRGCVYCESEAAKAYRAEFPDGPKPIATFGMDEMEKANACIGADAITKAFGPGGRGMAEILENIAKVGK